MAKSLAQRKADAKSDGWERWIRSEADEHAVLNGCYFRADKGQRVVSFFEKFLRLPEDPWAGQPFILMDWHRDEIVMPLYGWYRADGTRRYRKAYIEIPKKNAKSALCSGLGLYHLMADGVRGGQVYSAAASQEQARIVHRAAAKMVKMSPALVSRLRVIDTSKRIVHDESGSFFKAMSAEHHTQEGHNISALFFDELHAQRTRHLWDTLQFGTRARRQPLSVAITTAGWDRESICFEQHEYAQAILNGTIHDDRFFAYILAAKPDEEWKDTESEACRAVWRRTNPALGIILSEDDFADDVREAQQSVAQENTLKRYRFNIWTSQAVGWLSMDAWHACPERVPDEELLGEECFAGLDLASTQDLSSMALFFPKQKAVKVWFWVPEDVAEAHDERDEAPYLEWARDGLITLTDGNVLDQERIRDDINAIVKSYRVREAAVDKYEGNWIMQKVGQLGVTPVMFPQTYAAMNEPAKALERMVLARELAHGHNPVLDWQAGNVGVKLTIDEKMRPVKMSRTGRIDGIVALTMAIGRAIAAPPAVVSPYLKGGRGAVWL